jgi:hypothetical protein
MGDEDIEPAAVPMISLLEVVQPVTRVRDSLWFVQA